MDPGKPQNTSEQPRTQGSSDERPKRRPRSAEPLTDDEKRLRARERYHERKAQLTAEQKKAITQKNTQTKAKNRANETPEQHQLRNQQNAQAMVCCLSFCIAAFIHADI